MRIKNLDTGEEYDLEDYDSSAPSQTGLHGPGDANPPGTLDDEELQLKAVGGKKKAWLKGTKKLKSWAKNTYTNVRDKIEERIEKQQQRQQQQQQQQQQGSANSGSFGGWAAGDAAAVEVPEGPSRSAADMGAPLEEYTRVSMPAEALTPDASWTGDAGGGGGRLRTSSHDASSLSSSAVSALTGRSTWTGSGSAAAATRNAVVVAAAGSGTTTDPFGPRRDPGLPAPPLAPPVPAEGLALRGSAGTKAGGCGPVVPPFLPPRGTAAAAPLSAAASSSAGFVAAAPSGGLSRQQPGAIPLAASGAHQQSAELRIPLLEEDQAGPSSRAVPTSKSWLNQSARVIGGRRAAGRQLQQVRMVQELLGHDGVVWAMRFSADARLLATAGRDGVLRVWSVYWYSPGRSKLISVARDTGPSSSSVPFLLHPPSSSAALPPPPSVASTSAPPSALVPRPPLLSESPLLSLPGHRGDVLDLSWSQCRLLLTASADQTARLWHIDVGVAGVAGSGVEAGGGRGPGGCPSAECLRSFVHPDFVTSCCFHPTDPRRIVTGCADGKIRIWSVPDASVLATATVQQDLVTRVLFSADGSRVVVGTLRGKARHYEFTGTALDYLTQLDVKNPHGSGRKVTGLVQVPYTYGNDQLYVITSADSRIRLYVGYSQERKFKGHRHSNTQIAASLSPSCRYLVCGSDDGWVYVWETGLPPPPGPPGPGHPAGASSGGVATTAAAAGAGGAAGPGRSKGGAKIGGSGGKIKEGTYEAFQTPEQTTTVALFAPNICRLGRGFPQQMGTVVGSSSGAMDTAAGSAASPLLGALFVVAGFSGRIYVYENLPAHGA